MPSAHEMGGRQLRELQRWFMARVSADEAIAAPAWPVGEVIQPSAELSSEQRLGIYTEMYLERIREALADDFPGVVTLLGDSGFAALVREYLLRYPSRSFTLAHIGRSLPRFLAEVPRFGGAGVRDVARVELALTEAAMAADTTELGPGALADVSPEEWSLARFRLTEGFELIATAFDVPTFLDGVAAGGHPALAEQRAFVAVWRHQHTVWRRSISAAAHQTLSALSAGRTVADALDAALAATTDEGLEGEVYSWFGQWLDDGFISAVVLPTREIRSDP